MYELKIRIKILAVVILKYTFLGGWLLETKQKDVEKYLNLSITIKINYSCFLTN